MTRSEPLRIASRASDLALRQAGLVQAALLEAGVKSEITTFRTTGDKRLDAPLASIGGKGLFTRELELALAAGRVDLCVHSLKDLPTESPPGLEIAACLEREDPRDVLVLNELVTAESIAELPAGTRIGTSSLRRRAQLLALRGDVEVAELRGNVPTRLRKVDEGRVHGAILAAAGLLRLGAEQHIRAFLDAPGWLPAAGQGIIAVQIRSGDERIASPVRALAHPETERAALAERAFLEAMDGGCQVPIGALATNGAAAMVLHGLISDDKGEAMVRGEIVVDPSDPERSGRLLAADLRVRGGEELVRKMREAKDVPAPQPE